MSRTEVIVGLSPCQGGTWQAEPGGSFFPIQKHLVFVDETSVGRRRCILAAFADKMSGLRERHRHALCVAALLTLTSVASSQQYSFRHYGAAEGLQNLVVLSLAQDGSGHLWAGTEAGLYRYDGTRFRLMAAAEGLP